MEVQQHTVACTQGQLGRQRCPFFWEAIWCAAWIWLTHSCSSAASASPTAPLPQRKSSMSEAGASDRLTLACEGQEVTSDNCKRIQKRISAKLYPPANTIALHQSVVAANDDGTEANLGCHIQDSIAVGLQAGRVTLCVLWRRDGQCRVGPCRLWHVQAAA